jgi:NADH-quinone oxidoreductase subunit C
MNEIVENVPDLAGKFPDDVLEKTTFRGETTFFIKPDSVEKICRTLKDDGYVMLNDITAVHPDSGADYFHVVYHIYSMSANSRIRLKARVPKSDPKVPTVTTIWKGANWYERETWDMFGIVFEGHPNLERILTPEGFQGHPLRKDYPLRGTGKGI